MDFDVSNVSFCGSTRNWGSRGIKAPDKAAKLVDKAQKMAKDYHAKQRPQAELYEDLLRESALNISNKLKGLSLKEIKKMFPKF